MCVNHEVAITHIYLSQKSLDDEERGGNCLLVPERSYGPAIVTKLLSLFCLYTTNRPTYNTPL